MTPLEAELIGTLKSAAHDLREASGDIAVWGGYICEYFQQKWGLRIDVERYEKAAAVIESRIIEIEGEEH